MWFLFHLACTQPVPTLPVVEVDPHDAIDFAAVDACVSCHATVVGEWRESMHARAHHENDPIYGAMRALRMKKQGEGVAAKCAACHNPLSPSEPDSPAGRAGVACGACHTAKAVMAQEASDGRTVCLKCHAATANPKGADTCTTGPENELAGSAPCAACHLPPSAEDGHRVHRFLGPHRAWLQQDDSILRQAVQVSLTRSGDHVDVVVSNTTGHGFPTGYPGRIAAIRLTDGSWSAVPEGLTFRKVYTDEHGKPTMPPFAAKLAEDSRLKPGEQREAGIDLPKGTGEVHAELVFRLLPPKAAKVLGIQDQPESEPRIIQLTGP